MCISLLLYLQIFPSVPLFTPLSVLHLSRLISLLSCHCLHLDSIHLFLCLYLFIHLLSLLYRHFTLSVLVPLSLSPSIFYFLSFTRSVHHQFLNLFVFPPLPPSIPLSNVPIVMTIWENLDIFLFVIFFQAWKSYRKQCIKNVWKIM